ncbi:hypothetical protein JHK82_041883 [Glycine max]|uniref:At4g15545-like C-terminal domain-containing protein n=3 Tax=Glycine subgen. Soja TaxID=1462606 RepID=I1MFA1_SOYBN|nr:uncharacterized protein At4g15545 [Glycine max]XP_028202489.1 uncharacterized protein At4g15545-like [Glycine soja]KAG4948702.1 hypothetical protein JHK86_041941 [Glycine max]KAG5104913.1 hypothetical protein JHK82_041883 [Glycine max]KAG5116039.1 hypothetical protein JHK84_042152 [Glycine max]KRH11308.1 hypothetical protein GLYMA_15G100200v4 [Glycine max]RZB63913.1 hypothetical protein D0Y65_040477 [Glycine soja]|eukprot:XP_003546113.1 uncharacterized protein At4g15545 [Glycine max]
MLVSESSGSKVDLPEELLNVLPSDPYEQLDVARKITSVALSTRVDALQSESSALRAELADRNRLIAELQSQVESIDAALSEAADKLARADQDKENLLKENASLSNTVRKLTRDVSKLETFRKTLMKSLREDEDTSEGTPDTAAKLHSQASFTSTSQFGDDDASSTLSSRTSSMRINTSDMGNYLAEDRESDGSKSRASHNLLLASQTSTPRITPPGSPPSMSALVSPTRTSSKPVSPRRHAISFSTSRGMFDDRSSVGSQTGRTRVDGKEFFRQVRSRLSYEQFGAFLANVKELNSHKQTKEETLQKANELFGPENKDLYTIFEGLITRNVH